VYKITQLPQKFKYRAKELARSGRRATPFGDYIMNFLHYPLRLTNESAVRVDLDKRANVKLLDGSNFSRYRSGSTHRYFGGQAVRSPIVIRAPHAGDWHLVIDLGGYPGSVRASVSVI
jgi:hypothetical protein